MIGRETCKTISEIFFFVELCLSRIVSVTMFQMAGSSASCYCDLDFYYKVCKGVKKLLIML